VDLDKNQPAMEISKNEDEKFNAIKQALLDEQNLTPQKGLGTKSSNTKAVHQEYIPSYGHNAYNPSNRGSRH